MQDIGPLYAPGINPKPHSTTLYHLRNFPIEKLSDYEVVFMINIFTRMNKRLNGRDYESAYKNQCMDLPYDLLLMFSSSRGRLRDIIKKLIELKIIKKLSRSTYLINPYYAENLFEHQRRYSLDIIEKEFG